MVESCFKPGVFFWALIPISPISYEELVVIFLQHPRAYLQWTLDKTLGKDYAYPIKYLEPIKG